MEKKEKKKALLAASVAGLMAVVAMTGFAQTASADPCYGVNACKGKGDCGGAGHSCAGMNACKGQGYLEVAKDTCLKIQGGSLTPAAPAATPTAG